MRILYTPAGDTDPIRGFRDGAILHIIRKYKPEKAIIFLSLEMTEKENNTHLYSKAIKSLDTECEIEFINSGLKDVHHMETLLPLAEEFVKIRKAYGDAEILLNLSSGTPQMKTIMSFLATDFDNVRAIQVDSPSKGSNRRNHATQDSDDIDVMIETNEDNEPGYEDRCSEPQLKFLRRYAIRYQIISLVLNYEYSSALAIYKKNKSLFSDVVGKLLEHAVNREMLKFDEAKKIISSVNGFKLDLANKKEVQNLNEFLMVMELRQRQKKLPDFLVKITPFLYCLALFYFKNNLRVNIDNITSDNGSGSKSKKISLAKTQRYYPVFASALNKEFKVFRDNTELAFSNILVMMEQVNGCDSRLLSVFKNLRKVEQKQRNYAAHTIISISEEALRSIEPFWSSNEIFNKLREAFMLVMKNEKKYEKNVYDEINKYIIKSLDDFKL